MARIMHMLRAIRHHPRKTAAGAALALVMGALIFSVTYGQEHWGTFPLAAGWAVWISNGLGQPVLIKESGESLVVWPGKAQLFGSPGPGQLRVHYEVNALSGRRLGCFSLTLNPQVDTAATIRPPLEACK
jgi:hypothetical protein